MKSMKSFRCDDELWNVVKIKAIKEDKNVTQIITLALRKYAATNKKTGAKK